MWPILGFQNLSTLVKGATCTSRILILHSLPRHNWRRLPTYNLHRDVRDWGVVQVNIQGEHTIGPCSAASWLTLLVAVKMSIKMLLRGATERALVCPLQAMSVPRFPASHLPHPRLTRQTTDASFVTRNEHNAQDDEANGHLGCPWKSCGGAT